MKFDHKEIKCFYKKDNEFFTWDEANDFAKENGAQLPSLDEMRDLLAYLFKKKQYEAKDYQKLGTFSTEYNKMYKLWEFDQDG